MKHSTVVELFREGVTKLRIEMIETLVFSIRGNKTVLISENNKDRVSSIFSHCTLATHCRYLCSPIKSVPYFIVSQCWIDDPKRVKEAELGRNCYSGSVCCSYITIAANNL